MNSKLVRFSVVAAMLLIVFIAAMIPVFHRSARAQGEPYMNYTSKKGFCHVACSADGKYVYVVGDEGVLRSTDFGKKGSWERVVSEE